jgi:hypothetical protein
MRIKVWPVSIPAINFLTKRGRRKMVYVANGERYSNMKISF